MVLTVITDIMSKNNASGLSERVFMGRASDHVGEMLRSPLPQEHGIVPSLRAIRLDEYSAKYAKRIICTTQYAH